MDDASSSHAYTLASPYPKYFPSSPTEDFSCFYNGYVLRVLRHCHLMLSYLVSIYVHLLIWIVFIVYPMCVCVCVLLLIFLLIFYVLSRVYISITCHFYDKKNEIITYLTLLKNIRREEHWIFNSPKMRVKMVKTKTP